MNATRNTLAATLLIPVLTACGAAATPAALSSTLGIDQERPAAQATMEPRWDLPGATPAPTRAAAAPMPALPAATQPAWPSESVPATATPIPSRNDGVPQEFPINPFVDAWVDPLSTFALDVDTASYTRTRDLLLAGRIPAADSIRVEEFLNYFDAGYPAPPDVAFAVYADGSPSPFHADGSALLRIGVQGYRVPDEERKPLALTFVIDASGSMASEGKLEMVKRALTMLARRLRPSDTVAIAAYSSDAWLVLPVTNGYDQEAVIRAVSSLQPTNSTNVEAGLRLGYSLAWQAFRSDASNRVILCSDGVANQGNTDPDAILEFVRGYTEHGITLTTIGVGMGEYNDELLERLADRGDGNYAYVDTEDEARRVLVDELVSTLQVIARDAKIQVDFNAEVVARYRLIGYENRAVADRDFRNDAVDAGEIGAGHSAVALYAVQLREGARGRIATVQLRWEDPDTREVREIRGDVSTWDLSPRFEDASAHFQLAAAAGQFAELLRGSPWAYSGGYGMLAQTAYRLTELLPEDGVVRELASLISIAAELSR